MIRFLDGVEKIGNKLPDPAMLFLLLLGVLMVLSWPAPRSPNSSPTW